jgi:uncharacterized protein with PIN domain
MKRCFLHGCAVRRNGTRAKADWWQLNRDDCFAYAQAKLSRAALLFKGGDFSMTDVQAAV